MALKTLTLTRPVGTQTATGVFEILSESDVDLAIVCMDQIADKMTGTDPAPIPAAPEPEKIEEPAPKTNPTPKPSNQGPSYPADGKTYFEGRMVTREERDMILAARNEADAAAAAKAPVKDPEPAEESKPEPAPGTVKEPTPAEDVCTECGVPVGKTEAQMSQMFMGKSLCKKCLDKARNQDPAENASPETAETWKKSAEETATINEKQQAAPSEPSSEDVCTACGAPASKSEAQLSQMFMGKTLCKKCLDKSQEGSA